MHQYEIEARAYDYYYSHGAQTVAYLAIVGSGKDINTWHYFSNRQVIESNQLVVFDYAASLDHMTMDITRTFNISGKFTPDQAKWYNVDLESQKATIALLKPGYTYEEAEAAGKAVFNRAGIGEQWYGFPGHFVGLATLLDELARIEGLRWLRFLYAYPFPFPEEDHDFIRFLGDTLQNQGFKNGVSNIIGRAHRESNPYFLPRLGVNSWDHAELLKAKVLGGYDWMHWPQLVKKRVLHNATLMQPDRKAGAVKTTV